MKNKFACWLVGHDKHQFSFEELVWIPGMDATEWCDISILTCDRCGKILDNASSGDDGGHGHDPVVSA